MGYQCCNNCHLFRSSKRNGQIDCCWKDRDENCPWVWFHPWHGDWSWIRLPVSANTYWPPQIKNIRRRISIQQKRAVLLSQGVVYAIYTKKGYEDIIVPCPNLGDAIGNGLLQGVMLALTAGR
jgi:hypothetical protein